MTERATQIRTFFDKEQQGFLQLIQALVEEETPSDEAESFTKIISILRTEFENQAYDVKHIKGNSSAGQLLCTPENFDPEAPQQLIVGHIDTVWDKGILSEMPFQKDGNIVSGPGIYDMKTGVAMMVYAIKAMRACEMDAEVQAVFLITTDEETGSHDSKDLIIERAQKAERTYVLEPALNREGKIKTSRKGVGHFEITIKGQPSHAGLDPEKGVSAILGLSHIVQQLFHMNEPAKGVSVNVGTIEGGERSNVIAAKSKAVVDVRVETKEDGERIKSAIYNLQPEIEGVELKVTGGINRPPMEKHKNNEKLWNITQKLGKELELELEEGMSGGASDGNFTNLYSPTIDGLGAVGEGAHAYHEKIFLEETLERACLFTLLLAEPSIDFPD